MLYVVGTLFCLPESEWPRDGGRLQKAAVLAGVELVSPDSAQVCWAQAVLGSVEIEILAVTSATLPPDQVQYDPDSKITIVSHVTFNDAEGFGWTSRVALASICLDSTFDLI